MSENQILTAPGSSGTRQTHLKTASAPTRDARHSQLEASQLLDKSEIAALMNCSERHLDRMRAAGQMPAPVRLGALVRFRRTEIEGWIAAGCPAVRR